MNRVCTYFPKTCISPYFIYATLNWAEKRVIALLRLCLTQITH